MSESTYVVESSSTADVSAADRAEFWREHIADYQTRLAHVYERTDDFRGETVRQRTASFQLVEFASEPITYARTARQISADGDEDYRFLMPVQGGARIRQGGEDVLLSRGAGGLLAFGVPFEAAQTTSTKAYILTIPASEVNGPLNRSAPLSLGVDLTTGLGRVLAQMTLGLADERDRLTAMQFDAICVRLAELLCMLAVGDDRPTASGHLAEVEMMVRRYVRGHAADLELTGATVARELGWSLRQVQLALQQAGTTPRELIKEERLRLVRVRLNDPRFVHMTISELAHASGFTSASVLSTAFRQRYGVSPRELRHEHRES
ncbi:AraC family transcriptional regulator [Actinomadura barringtoniae]|uniref:AraC family transcriptional regulator n=1 Tax=Actinomadura barringtoniae TaxID=1427535 RepID=A0A939PLP8_9ACTN|nr:AraC family transcriptional regulator [Actinomadura barringtoniae]MBO2455247.1 AraC family transcriptional regulator [Actinomadura barringtoniae]